MSCPTLATAWAAARQAPLLFTVSQSLLKLMSIESVVPSNHLTLFHPLLLLPSVFLSIFSSDSSLYIRWPNYWSFSFSVSPSNEYSGLISFRIDWFDRLAGQGTLKSLLKKKKESSPAPQFGSINYSTGTQPSLCPALIYDHYSCGNRLRDDRARLRSRGL